jgi:hypothetical protein
MGVMDDDEVSELLRQKSIDTACRRCGKDEWSLSSRDAIVPDIADHIELAGGTAATVRTCAYCGCIELYNRGMLNLKR